MKSVIAIGVSIIAMSLSFAAHAAASSKPIQQIRCAQPGGRTTVVKLDLINEKDLVYSYQVSLAGDGKAFTERQPVQFTGEYNGFRKYEVSKNADADTFLLDTVSGQGWISLIEFNALPFEFEVECQVK